jgi:A/G-specific adenine glycosylase
LVSELMLQQTQVARVIPKYEAFLERFPDAGALAAANLGDVLTSWQGLGYNRRAKYLWQASQQIGKRFPDNLEDLVKLPGVGKNTAGAILAYAFNQPVLFVETNIRSVYLHHFLADRESVTDTEILDLLEQTLDLARPREFYWALMDYGSFLKQTAGNNISRSRHYVKQSPFAGSKRQVRGAVIRTLARRGYQVGELAGIIPDPRLTKVLKELEGESMIAQTDNVYHLT